MDKPYTIEEVFPDKDVPAWKHIIQMQCATLPDDLVRLPDDGAWFIAYLGGMPAGYGGIVEFGLQNKKTKKLVATPTKLGLLTRAGVLPSHRGHGLQQKLVQARLSKAKELGFTTVYSTTYDNPHSSNNLYACGLRMYAPQKPWGHEGTCYWRIDVKD